MVLGLVAMFVGSIAAIYQHNVNVFSYSSVAQIGYRILGLSLLNQSGLTGGIVHLFNHALMKCGLFLAVGCITYRIGSTQIADFGGLMRKMPITMWKLIVSGLSLIDAPGTVGLSANGIWYWVRGRSFTPLRY